MTSNDTGSMGGGDAVEATARALRRFGLNRLIEGMGDERAHEMPEQGYMDDARIAIEAYLRATTPASEVVPNAGSHNHPGVEWRSDCATCVSELPEAIRRYREMRWTPPSPNTGNVG